MTTPMTKITLAAAMLAAAFAPLAAKADDVAPMSGKSFAIEAASGSVYYTKESDGFRVVATMSAGEGLAPVRFVTTLADGQTVTVSVPVEAGKEPRAIAISRDGETLSVGEAEPLMVRASLD